MAHREDDAKERSARTDLEAFIKKARKFAGPYRVDNGKKFRLKDADPRDTAGLGSEAKPKAKEALQSGIQALAELQDMLYAQDRWAVLLIFQAMDAAGKDGAIKHVMSGVNPQGCQVASFKVPTSEELDHDFLWRCNKQLPERGRIGIFNRSYYEEVLIVKVHPELLSNAKLPPRLCTKDIWDRRYRDIRSYERYLGNNGVVVRKFFLNVSYKEQKKRFLERIDKPDKNWKFSAADVRERRYWDNYMHAYEEAICATASKDAPWFVVPADNKWFSRLVVAAAIVEAVELLDLEYPKVTQDQRKELAAARAELIAEK
jgi:PPK2 family polyphosphate:nucleotide phosphotransferase